MLCKALCLLLASTSLTAAAHAAEPSDCPTRWLELKLSTGSRVMTGRRIVENIHNSDPENSAPVRAVID
jgi:hypothetical protein